MNAAEVRGGAFIESRVRPNGARHILCRVGLSEFLDVLQGDEYFFSATDFPGGAFL